MAAREWAGGSHHPWFPLGWAAGDFASPSPTEKAFSWRRFCFGANPTRTLRRVMVWATGTLIFFHQFLVPIKVSGASMQPTYRDGSVNFINRLSYAHSHPKRGDVVILRDFDDDLILKRVVAMPGERVTLERGVFKINGQPLADKFSIVPINWDLEPINLGPDEYFVIGDNRAVSIFGKYNQKQILGKVLF